MTDETGRGLAAGVAQPGTGAGRPADPTIGAAEGERRPTASVIDRLVIPAALFGLAWFVYALINHHRPANLDYFVPLADAFLHGRLGLTEAPSFLNELVPGGNGLYYVVYPPMPALLLLPVVLVAGPDFDQAWASILLGAANVVVMSWLIEGMGASRRFRIVMSLVFAFGTIVWYSAQAGSSWHFAHVVATFFMLLGDPSLPARCADRPHRAALRVRGPGAGCP